MKTIILNILFLFFSICAFSQIENIPTSSLWEMEMFSENMKRESNSRAASLNENKVFIQQVGEGNNVTANIRSENSNVSYTQEGNFNHIGVDVFVADYQSTINQNGNNNNFFDQMYNSNTGASMELNQTGDNLHFERFGSNSIGDNLQFNMTGDSRSIIVRNFN
ncbi:hypothetical protein [Salegentibacter sp. Hel_I_6]|uniref:hypothetical protein n=1 Tax=Salegentibacter sp. Hel_I_6 TaxID=1250278 RepID=UPI0012E09680|nr:hypothetical protein [Salegentibacter sp. Hel_I_6]